MSKIIPLSEPHLGGNEWKYIKDCLDTGWVSSAGKYVDLFEEKIAEYTGAKYAIACVNGTSAIQLSLRLVGVEPADEVIVPTLTFIASVNAIAYNNASPIFMDADQFYNIDYRKTMQFIQEETVFKGGSTYNKKTSKRIAAIVPVHVWGNAVWFDELIPLCEERNIAVVEDASESLGTYYASGMYRGRHTGTIGKLGCLSFNGNKIITTGGGGMILTDDPALAEKAKYLSTQAKDDPVRYIHNEIGFNFRLTNIQAAMGLAQLEQLPSILLNKIKIHEYYCKAIKDLDGLCMAEVPSYADNNLWLNVLQIDKAIFGKDKEVLMHHLKENGIQTRPVWAVNHKQKPFSRHQYFCIRKADQLAEQSLCLPSSGSMSMESAQKVVAGICG